MVAHCTTVYQMIIRWTDWFNLLSKLYEGENTGELWENQTSPSAQTSS